MKVGVTGTRVGMTEHQFNHINEFLKVLIELEPGAELHHGDCVGVDAEVATLARELGYKVVCHPPEKVDLRAYVEYDECRVPLSYFARNRNIVNECDVLLVVPRENERQEFGGTWYTHDYAHKQNKLATVIYPEKPDEENQS